MPTAKQSYKIRLTENKNQIKQLQTALTKHAEKFKKNDTDWGFVGDLGHVKASLYQINVFLSKASK
jgi:hypothetical protein